MPVFFNHNSDKILKLNEFIELFENGGFYSFQRTQPFTVLNHQ